MPLLTIASHFPPKRLSHSFQLSILIRIILNKIHWIAYKLQISAHSFHWPQPICVYVWKIDASHECKLKSYCVWHCWNDLGDEAYRMNVISTQLLCFLQVSFLASDFILISFCSWMDCWWFRFTLCIMCEWVNQILLDVTDSFSFLSFILKNEYFGLSFISIEVFFIKFWYLRVKKLINIEIFPLDWWNIWQ